MNKKLTMVLCLVLVVMMVAGCNKAPTVTPATFKQAEYNTTTKNLPSNWNELTYADNNDVQILGYIGSSFFDYDYKFENDKKFNEDGSINKAGIVAGGVTTNYSAATKLEDVTSLVDAKWGYTDEQKEQGGYAWKITLRDDLKWDDGTPIKAADFVWSMQQQLDPAFMNFRANTYYDTLKIKNAKTYFYSGSEGYEAANSLHAEYDASKDDQIIWKLSSSSVKDPKTGTAMSSLRASYNSGYEKYGMNASQSAGEYLVALSIAFDAPVELTVDQINALEGKTLKEIKEDATLKATYDYLIEWWDEGEYGAYAFAVSYYKNDPFDFNDVGIYSIDDENAIVICLDKAFALLKEDGSLSYLAAYNLSSLPLVHKAKYEASKIAPGEGATLWTSNYNSSLANTASWGPYKLAEFEAGSHYKLVKNENWYGWNMEQYKNQYNITAINCREVSEWSTQWMGFLSGAYDDASLETGNVAEYMDSKYVYYTSTGTGTFGMQLYSNLDVLKNSNNNNGILAILEFRQALNLALNRSDLVEKIWPGSAIPCFGLINSAYYYDIENSAILADGGQYRNTKLAKEGILRAYGFTEGENGKWSSGSLVDLDLDDAYDALTGYNPTLAKEKLREAIAELTANAETYGYDATKDITLVFGASVDDVKYRIRADYLQGVVNDLSAGTELEGKIKIVFDASAGEKWSDAFRSGATQIGFGYGFQGNPFDPFDIVGSFVDPSDKLNYHMYWNTSVIDMTLTMPAGDYQGAGETITMSVQNWFFCLNGLAESEKQPKIYNWSAGFAPVEARLMILSALEEVTIKESRSIMLIAESGGSFLGAKFSYFSDVENVFMGFGGLRYMEVNYTDAEWTAYVAANNNDLTEEYKKSE